MKPYSKRIVLIIPYYGKIPNYFNLWLKSAEKNPDITFLIYTDLEFPVSDESNVKIKHMSFRQLKEKIWEKLGNDCIVDEPYKLCDYKPAYGEIFEEDIRDFDFWGFCDIDLIFGNLHHFISDEMLEKYDKLYSHGHFCLMRNNEKMNKLYRKEYPNVLNFQYTKQTNYICHFDENGTIAYAHEYDDFINLYDKWVFYDVPYISYKMIYDSKEAYVKWKNGNLYVHTDDEIESDEIMYVHLQKRKMHVADREYDSQIILYRNEFVCSADNFDIHKIDMEKEQNYINEQKKSRKRSIVNNILKGALKFRIYRVFYRWKTR